MGCIGSFGRLAGRFSSKFPSNPRTPLPLEDRQKIYENIGNGKEDIRKCEGDVRKSLGKVNLATGASMSVAHRKTNLMCRI